MLSIMKRARSFTTAAVLACLLEMIPVRPAFAKDVALFTAPDAFWIGSKGRRDPAEGGLVLLGPTVPSASWYVGEFNNPGAELPPFTRQMERDGRTVFVSRADAASAVVDPSTSGSPVTILQDNSTMPCTLPNGGPGEFDLLLGMNHLWVNRLKPDATAADPKPGTYDRLSNMAALHTTLTVTQVREWSPYSEPRCAVNQGNLMVALTLRDDEADPPQIMYYELALRSICHQGPTYDACLGRRRKSAFYWTGNTVKGPAGHVMKNYGYRDTLASFGQDVLGASETRTFSLDLLPALRDLFTSTQHGLDPDLTHWRVMSAYYGQNIWGNVGLSSRWSGFRLDAAIH